LVIFSNAIALREQQEALRKLLECEQLFRQERKVIHFILDSPTVTKCDILWLENFSADTVKENL
jgi:hypothetical protein